MATLACLSLAPVPPLLLSQGTWETRWIWQTSLREAEVTLLTPFLLVQVRSTSYTAQDFEIDGFQVTAGGQTRSLNRFIFDDAGPFDAFSV